MVQGTRGHIDLSHVDINVLHLCELSCNSESWAQVDLAKSSLVMPNSQSRTFGGRLLLLALCACLYLLCN